MKILHVSCSPRGQASESYRLSSKIINYLLEKYPAAMVVNRVLGGGALSDIDEGYATALGSPQNSTEARPCGNTIHKSEELIQELEASDILVISTPMHNFTVPSALKAWLDHIVRIGRTFRSSSEGKKGALRDRPVFVAVASGGRYSGERTHQPDFLTPYLIAILGTIGLNSLKFFSIEGVVLGSKDMARARDEADQVISEYFQRLEVNWSHTQTQRIDDLMPR